MIKGQKKPKLGRKASHTRLLLRNLLRSLFTNGYLTTTTIKAKALRQEALLLLNSLKKAPTLVNVKKASVQLGSREMVEKIVKYVQGNEPTIKLVKIGYRDGDKAQTSRISVVGFIVKKAKAVKKENKKDEKKAEVVKEQPKVKAVGLGKAIKETFTGRRERSRSRSGI
ncbi:bL17 family ribosomal protein [Candidatus Dojkabacteria bacterium]|jgi:ribosomal protein L17|nr:bL17 family ribosomal protein [Candidatus Dojkabacteria bacterium]